MTTRPAIRGTMGSITYYETLMPARELTSSVRPARETERWASMSIDERMQRDPNLNRIKQEIAPYLATHPDRFFGSVIVLVPEGSVSFESISEFANVPAAYKSSIEKVGFVTLGPGEHIALDGQHRLLALREVITSPQSYGPNEHAVADDEICVILIEHESDKKTRTIFNKVNRHARPTSSSDNIITSEDDGYAVVTRRLLDASIDAPLAARDEKDVVEWQRSSLTKTSMKLTTLTALYETVRDILRASGFQHFGEKDDPVAPAAAQIDEAYEIASDWWQTILTMPQFVDGLAAPERIPEVRHSPTDSAALLFRPVGQISLVKGLTQAYTASRGELSVEQLVRRASKVDWSPIASNYWRDVVVRPDGRMIAKREAYNLAATLLEYLIAPEVVDDEMQLDLWKHWNVARGKLVGVPVDELAPEEIPQELPAPVTS